jgi:hypothetical protein
VTIDKSNGFKRTANGREIVAANEDIDVLGVANCGFIDG